MKLEIAALRARIFIVSVNSPEDDGAPKSPHATKASQGSLVPNAWAIAHRCYTGVCKWVHIRTPVPVVCLDVIASNPIVGIGLYCRSKPLARRWEVDDTPPELVNMALGVKNEKDTT